MGASTVRFMREVPVPIASQESESGPWEGEGLGNENGDERVGRVYPHVSQTYLGEWVERNVDGVALAIPEWGVEAVLLDLIVDTTRTVAAMP
jgi:hypothetical protein